MKLKVMLKWIAVLGIALLAAQAYAEERLVLKTEKDKENYVTGVSIVRNLKQQGGEVNLDIVIQGMKDELTGEKLLLTEDDLMEIMFALKTDPKYSSTALAGKDKDPARKTMTGTQKPSQTPVQERMPVPDEERTLAALAHASIAPSKGNAQQTPASSSLAPAQQDQAPVLEHTFAALALQQQQQINDDGTVQIVLSDLMRRHAEYWLKTLPHQQ